MKKVIAMSATLLMFAAAPAFADMNSSNVSISFNNSGAITNTTSATASTGGNTAGGSNGGNGGRGGRVTADGAGSFNNGGAVAGDGGKGGNAGTGGAVQSGDAHADAGTANTLNANDIAIGPDCGCHTDMNSSALAIAGTSTGVIDNTTRARARTGNNTADGSTAGEGGRGGRITADGSGSNNNGGAVGGFGGNGGMAGLGGSVLTGLAVSHSGTVNMLNTNLLRVNH